MRVAALRPPRLRTIEDETADRHATWTELFYDLVFVVAVAQLAARLLGEIERRIGRGRLLGDLTLGGALSFVGYFIAIWWAWAGYTFYADRYDTDDLGQRVLAVLQMGAVAAMAASLSGDESGSSQAFAGSYFAARMILIVMYVRARRHVPQTRELVSGYIRGFSLAALLWLASIFVDEPFRFVLWAVALSISFATPYVMRKIQAKVPLDVAHLPERFGLFTILVLGESIAAIVTAITHEGWSVPVVIGAGLAVAIAAGLWWVYFDNLQGSVVRRSAEQKKAWRPTVWIYSHLPLAIGLTATGVGLEELVLAAAGHDLERAPRLLVTLALATTFAMMALISIANDESSSDARSGRSITRAQWRMAGALAVLVIGLLGGGVSAIGFLLLLSAVCLVQVLTDVRMNAMAG